MKKPKARYYKAPHGMSPKYIKTSAECSEVLVCHFPSNKWHRYISDRPYPDDTGEGLTEITEAEYMEYHRKSNEPTKKVRA